MTQSSITPIGITRSPGQDTAFSRFDNVLTIKYEGGRSHSVEIPLRSGTFEHLNDAELYELAVFLRLRGLRSKDTHRAYVRQLERFLLWMRLDQRNVIDEWTLMDYQAALRNPPEFLRHNTVEITFATVSEETADQYLAPIRSFCSHLTQKGLIRYNPGKFVPRLAASNTQTFSRSKHFDDDQWPVVQSTLDDMPEDTPGQRNRKARLRFCILFGYAMGLRIGEQLSHTHADIKTIKSNWVLDVVGKGRRARRLSLTDIDTIALDELQRYRSSLSMPAYPAGERLPLLPSKAPIKYRGRGKERVQLINESPIADSTWQGQFKHFIQQDVMQSLLPEDAVVRQHVYENEWSHLTPHSLRHTRITHLVESGKDLLYVQKFAGHEKLDTTAVYFH